MIIMKFIAETRDCIYSIYDLIHFSFDKKSQHVFSTKGRGRLTGNLRLLSNYYPTLDCNKNIVLF